MKKIKQKYLINIGPDLCEMNIKPIQLQPKKKKKVYQSLLYNLYDDY